MERGRALIASHPRRRSLAVLLGYGLVSFVYLGIPLVSQEGPRYVGFDYDPKPFVWAFGWWPHALLHGDNPFFTHAVWAPYGVNAMWSTTVPGLSIAFAPITIVFGALVSYNVAAIVLPALAAWTAFRLCLYLTDALWPSLVGGYLFGFSSYMLDEIGVGGHLNLGAVFLVPVTALLVVRRVDGSLGQWAFVLRLAAVLAAQFVLSTEIALTLTLALVVSLAVAAACFAERERIVALGGPLVAAYAAAGIVVAPFVYYALTGYREGAFYRPDFVAADLANFVVPTEVTALGGTLFRSLSHRFGGAPSEDGAYLGIPLLILLAVVFWESRRRPSTRFLLVCFALSVVASLGTHAVVAGTRVAVAPWALFHELPLLRNVLTGRLVMFATLVIAVAVASWITTRRQGIARWALPACAVLTTLPNPIAGHFSSPYGVPSFFTDRVYRECLAPGETVLALPLRAGSSVLWQVERDFRFRLAGGEIGPDIPLPFVTGASTVVTGGDALGADDALAVQGFIERMGVTTVVVDEKEAASWVEPLNRLTGGHSVGGVVLYRFGPAPPNCP